MSNRDHLARFYSRYRSGNRHVICVEELDALVEESAAISADRDRLLAACTDCHLFAIRESRKATKRNDVTEGAKWDAILKFCKEGGIKPDILRGMREAQSYDDLAAKWWLRMIGAP